MPSLQEKFSLSFFKAINLIALILALFVVGLGAYTRLQHAGLGCPDWPGCYGHTTVPSQEAALQHSPEADFHAGKAWTEMTHRYFAGSLAVLILVLFILSLLCRKELGHLRGISGFLLVLVIAQAALGMYTVTLKLHPLIVTGHLIGGFATLSLLFWLYLKVICQAGPLKLSVENKPGARPWLVLALIVLSLQIFLGGWTSSNYAALACPDFPTCLGRWVVPVSVETIFDIPLDPHLNYEGGLLGLEARSGIHWLHRVGAIFVVLFYLKALIPLLRRQADSKINLFARWVLVFLVGQVLLGISNVIFFLPLPVAVAHNVNASLLLLATLALLFQISVCSKNIK